MKTLFTLLTVVLMSASITFAQESVLERSIEVKESVKTKLVEKSVKQPVVKTQPRQLSKVPKQDTKVTLIHRTEYVPVCCEQKSVNPFNYMYQSWINRPRLQLRFIPNCR